jgi:hypothetical protein
MISTMMEVLAWRLLMLSRARKRPEDLVLFADLWLPQKRWWKSTTGLTQNIVTGVRIAERASRQDCTTGKGIRRRRSLG